MIKVKRDSTVKPKLKSKRKIEKRITTALTPKLKKLGPIKLKELASKKPNNAVVIKKLATEDKGPINFVKSPWTIDEDQVKRGVNALYQYVDKKSVGKTELFEDEQPIFLQIVCVKVPNTPYRQIRLRLPNSLLVNTSNEICLIVKDIGKPKEHEETIEHFEKLLQEKDVTNIKTIMPLHQFRTEYGNQFELKRKLLGLYDHFLVDGRICGKVVHLLGKIFSDKRKTPTPIKLELPNLKEHIDKALKKTTIKIHSKGDSYAVQIGHTKMSQEQVYENIIGVIDELSFEFPGSFENIRALGIKTSKSILIPIYLTLKNRGTVQRSVVRPKRPKEFEGVRGELSTHVGKEVIVLPSGEVTVHTIPEDDNMSVLLIEEEMDPEITISDEEFQEKEEQSS